MANQRNILAIKNSINYYNLALNFYKKIKEDFLKLETGDEEGEKEFILDKILLNNKELSKYMKRINIPILQGNYPKESIDILEKNLEIFKETVWYTERSVYGKKLYDMAISNIESLVAKSNLDPFTYSRYADNEKQLAKKICSTLTDPKHVLDYKQILTRLSLGKVKVNEFKKLFEAIRSKMIPSPKNESFERFVDFKKYMMS